VSGKAYGVGVDAMMGHVRTLSQKYPHRHSGEPDEELAVEYIASVFRDLGLDVRIHPIPIMGWELTGPSELLIRDPVNDEVECIPFIFSGSTPPGGITGQLEYVGPTLVIGTPPAWDKFAVTNTAGQHTAFVVGRPTDPPVTQPAPAGYAGTEDGPHYTWPACVIGARDADRFRLWLAGGQRVTVTLSISAKYKPGKTTYVVEANLRGRSRPDRVVLLGAHHDCQGAIGFPSKFDSPGGCDNASGVGALLELARLYSQAGYEKSLRFCTYGGEEWNLIGSRQYVRQLIETGELSTIDAAFNLDQMANGEKLWVMPGSATGPMASSVDAQQRDMEAVARGALERLALPDEYPVEICTPPMRGSDHWPFHAAGIPVLAVSWHPIPHYHMAGDTADACNRDDKYLAGVGLVQEMLETLSADRH